MNIPGLDINTIQSKIDNKTIAVYSHEMNGIDAADEINLRKEKGEYILPTELKNVNAMSLEITSTPYTFYLEDDKVIFDHQGRYTPNPHMPLDIPSNSYTLESLEKYINGVYETLGGFGSKNFDLRLKFSVVKGKVHIKWNRPDLYITFTHNLSKVLGIPYEWHKDEVTGTKPYGEGKLIHLFCELIDSSKNFFNGKQNHQLHTFKFNKWFLTPFEDTQSKIVPVGNHNFKTIKLWYTDSEGGYFNLLDHIQKVVFTFTFYQSASQR